MATTVLASWASHVKPGHTRLNFTTHTPLTHLYIHVNYYNYKKYNTTRYHFLFLYYIEAPRTTGVHTFLVPHTHITWHVQIICASVQVHTICKPVPALFIFCHDDKKRVFYFFYIFYKNFKHTRVRYMDHF